MPDPVAVFITQNQYSMPVLTFLLILYAALIAPNLSEGAVGIFDSPLFNLLIFFLIAYVARLSPSVGIIAAIGVMVSLITLNNYKVNKKLMAAIAIEDAKARSGVGQLENMTGDLRSYDDRVEIDTTIGQTQHIPEGALSDLKADQGVHLNQTESCPKRDRQNMFYPQYAHSKSDVKEARFSDGSVSGFDSTAAYASI